MATRPSLFTRIPATYDKSTQTYTDTSGKQYSMSESEAKKTNAIIIDTNPSLITKKKSTTSKKTTPPLVTSEGQYISDAQTYVSPTGELYSVSEQIAREGGARVFGTVKEYQDYNYAKYQEEVEKLKSQELPEIVSQQIEKEMKYTPPTIGQVYKNTDYLGRTTYTPVSGTISTTKTPTQFEMSPELQELYSKLKSLGYGFILQKYFYLPTDELKNEFVERLTSGYKGNLYDFQKKTEEQYEKDKSDYARAYIVYTNFPTTANINALNEIGNRLNVGLRSGNEVINSEFKDNKLLQSYKYSGYVQKYGTEYAAQLGLSLGLSAVGSSIRSGATATTEQLTKAAKIAKAAIPVESALYGYFTYRRTRDIEQAIFAGLGEGLFVGLPTAIDINSALKFRKALEDLKKSSAVIVSNDIIKTTDNMYVIQSKGERIGDTLKQNVNSNIIINPETNKVIYSTVESTISNIKTGKIVAKNTYIIDDIFTKKLNSIFSGMQKYGTIAAYTDIATNDQYLNGVLSYTTKIMNKQYSFFDNKIDEYINIDLEKREVSVSAENIKNIGISSTNIINEDILSSKDFMPHQAFTDFIKTTKVGKVSDMIAFPTNVPPITPKVKPTTGIINLLTGTKTSVTPGIIQNLDFGLLTSTSATYGAFDILPQVVDPSMLLINPAIASIQKTTIQTETLQAPILGLQPQVAQLITPVTTIKATTKTITKQRPSTTQNILQNSLVSPMLGQQLFIRPAQTQKPITTSQQEMINLTPPILPVSPVGAFSLGGFIPDFGFGATTNKKKKKLTEGGLNALPTLFQSQILGERKARYPSRRYTGFELLR